MKRLPLLAFAFATQHPVASGARSTRRTARPGSCSRGGAAPSWNSAFDGAATLRKGHHQGGQVERRRLHGSRDQREVLLRNPYQSIEQGISLEHADRQDNPGRRLWRTSNLSDRVVRWEMMGNKVHLRSINYNVVADPKSPIAQAVQAANNDTIIMTFPVAAFAKDGSPVIEVTRLFSTDVPEFSARQRLNATAMDASRSYIDRISPYPENIEAITTMTYTRAQPAGGRCSRLPLRAGGDAAREAPPSCCITAW